MPQRLRRSLRSPTSRRPVTHSAVLAFSECETNERVPHFWPVLPEVGLSIHQSRSATRLDASRYSGRMRTLIAAAVLLLATHPLYSQTTAAPDPHSVPSVDAAIGTCSADFTVTDADNKPVYNAKVKVRIAYGAFSIRKLDLEVATNIDGKARFTGLPNRLKRPLVFQASEGDREAEATDDVENTCKAQLTLTLKKK